MYTEEKEHKLVEGSAQPRSAATNNAVEHMDTMQVVFSLRHATVRIESGPLFTKLTVNNRYYYFDHVTGRLLQEGMV